MVVMPGILCTSDMEFDNEELKRIRDREGYTQKEIADAIGASVRTIRNGRPGKRLRIVITCYA